MHRRLLLSLLPALAMPGLLRAQEPLRVVASFSILGDMIRQVAGERIALRTVAGPNVDAHTFQPRPSDAEALRGAALAVRNGLGFDGWFDRMVRSANWRGRMVTTTDGLTPRRMPAHSHGHSHGHGASQPQGQQQGQPRTVPDPHAWQDLRLGIRYVQAIAAALSTADATNATAYAAAAEAYVARLTELDAWVRAQVAAVPEARRVVVTSHDAFGYFGAAYGIRFLAPQGVSTEAEPSTRKCPWRRPMRRRSSIRTRNTVKSSGARWISSSTTRPVSGRTPCQAYSQDSDCPRLASPRCSMYSGMHSASSRYSTLPRPIASGDSRGRCWKRPRLPTR
jgi:zinc/manganese transport system substrate-binding protein